MAQFELSTTLAARIEPVWEALQRPATLTYVSRGWLSFHPIDPPEFPERWPEGGGEFTVALTAFGVIPIGQQVLGISLPNVPLPRRALRDNGRGALMRVWDHQIDLRPEGRDATRYTDRIRIEAGWLTPLIAFWARGFYAHRQRRWHRLVRCGLETADC